jgi:hypothetical protein
MVGCIWTAVAASKNKCHLVYGTSCCCRRRCRRCCTWAGGQLRACRSPAACTQQRVNEQLMQPRHTADVVYVLEVAPLCQGARTRGVGLQRSIPITRPPQQSTYCRGRTWAPCLPGVSSSWRLLRDHAAGRGMLAAPEARAPACPPSLLLEALALPARSTDSRSAMPQDH